MVSPRPGALLHLDRLPLFESLSESARCRIAAAASVREVERGGEVFAAGEPCAGLYFVVEGLVKLYAKSPSGHEKVIEVLGAGTCLTDAWFLQGDHHVAHARALSHARVLIVSTPVVMTELNQHPELALRLLSQMSTRYTNLMRDVEALTLHSGSKRVVDYLLRVRTLAAGQRDGNETVVSLPASKGTIASLLSVTPEHFSRILHELQAQGLISVRRRQIHIPNIQRLAAFA